MKTKIIASVLLIVAIIVLRHGLEKDWDLLDVNFGTRTRPVTLVSMNTEHHIISAPDFGLVKLALVQARKEDKEGVPMWFVQFPFCKWRPLH